MLTYTVKSCDCVSAFGTQGRRCFTSTYWVPANVPKMTINLETNELFDTLEVGTSSKEKSRPYYFVFLRSNTEDYHIYFSGGKKGMHWDVDLWYSL